MKQVTKIAGALMLWLLAGTAFSQTPQWWIERGVVNTNIAPKDYAPVNQGQVKHIAYQAYLEFEQKLGGADPAIAHLIAGFSVTNNYLPVNLGQLKHLAKPFYDQLGAPGLTNVWPAGMTNGPYPWSGSISTNDFAVANIGQLKYLFSFNVDAAALDSDGDGMPDWWELLYFGSATGALATQDADNDGLVNLAEYLAKMDPLQPDTNLDGVPDAINAHMQGTSGEDGLLVVLPAGEYRHVTESALQLNAYGAYGE